MKETKMKLNSDCMILELTFELSNVSSAIYIAQIVGYEPKFIIVWTYIFFG